MTTGDVLPFCVAGLRIGLVHDVEPHAGFNRGKLVLDNDNCADARVIKVVVGLATRVDDALPELYQVAWQAWRDGCDEIQDLGIWIGHNSGPVEEFSIESNWSIEWRDMLQAE
jgi:hypothetical protein